MQWKITDGQNQTKNTPNHEAETCWNNSNNRNKVTLEFHYSIDIL